MSIALLIARLILGLGLSVHGAQKLFGWFAGYGPAGTGKFFEDNLGFRPGHFFAIAAGLGEFGGGLLLAAGLAGGFGPGLMILVMLTAIFTVHYNKGFLADKGGWEMPSLYIAGALAIDFAGFGAYSLDQVVGWNFFSTPADRWIIIGVAVVLMLLNLAIRRVPNASISSSSAA